MTRKAISIYMAATCAIVIIAPGRFACGLIIGVELILLMLTGLLFKALVKKINIPNLEQPLMLSFAIFFTILFKQALILISPILALQLSFVLFLPAISTFTTVFLLEEKNITLKESLVQNMPVSFGFVIYILFVFLIRDTIGFGTISLPSYGGLFEIELFSPEKVSFRSFFATIPGSLVLNALFLSFYLWFEKKIHIIKNAGVKK